MNGWRAISESALYPWRLKIELIQGQFAGVASIEIHRKMERASAGSSLYSPQLVALFFRPGYFPWPGFRHF